MRQLSTILVLAIAMSQPAMGEIEHPGKRLLAAELQTLTFIKNRNASGRKLKHIESLVKHPATKSALDALGLDAGKIALEDIEKIVSSEEIQSAKHIAALAGLVRFEWLKEQNPDMSTGKLAEKMLREALSGLPENDPSSGKFKELQDGFLASGKKDPGMMVYSSAQLRDAVALVFGDLFLKKDAEERRAVFEPEKAEPRRERKAPRPDQRLFPGNGLPFFAERGGVETAPHTVVTTPKQRHVTIPDSVASFPFSVSNSPGRARFAPGVPGISAQEAEFSDADVANLSQAGTDNDSLSMEIGRAFRDISGNVFFNAESLCQATVIDRTENQIPGAFCRFVVSSAAHCFNGLGSKAIKLQGFENPILAPQRRVFVGASEEEDAAVMLVDAPCDSKVQAVPVASKQEIRRFGNQSLLVDVQQTGKKSVPGKTVAADDGAFMGLNIVGQGRVFPGDSGGAGKIVVSGQKKYLGALSSKIDSPAFRDGVGYIAMFPDWARQLSSFFLSTPLSTPQLAHDVTRVMNRASHLN